MAARIELTCDKCNLVEIAAIASLSPNIYSRTLINDWQIIDDMVLCKKCIKDWAKSFKKIKKDNKEKFLKAGD